MDDVTTAASHTGGSDDGSPGAVHQLAPRERAVLRLVSAGYTNVEIANLLGSSLRSVEASRARLRRTLGVRTRAELVRCALDNGLADPR